PRTRTLAALPLPALSHATPPRHRRPARHRLLPADPLPLGDGLRGRLGLPHQEHVPGRMAAVPDDRAEPLADVAVVHDLRHRPRPGRDRRPPMALRRIAQPAPAAAAGIRHAGGGAAADLLPDYRAIRLHRQLRALLPALRRPRAVPRRPVHAYADLEPPVVPGLPVALHPGVAGGGFTAAMGAGTVGEYG